MKSKSRILLLIAFMLVMLLLCGCRVRVSNNSEVLSTLDDDGGWLQETYQQRRDELGIPVAKEPIINREGSEDYEGEDYEDDEYYGEDDEYYDDEEDYDEDEDYDEEDDDEVTTVRRTTPVVRRTVPVVRRVTPTPVRPSVRPTTPTVTTITVTLNLNASDAKCSRSSMVVIKGSTYGALPVPTRDGYTFKGWYTEKSGGKEVTSTTKLISDKAHTIYAHWKKTEKKEDKEEDKEEEEKKQYKISFAVNVPEEYAEKASLDKSEITVEEGGKYGDTDALPVPVWDKHKFEGWYTEPDDDTGTKVEDGDKFDGKEDQTLYAHWSDDSRNWWDNKFSETANEIKNDSKVIVALDTSDSEDEKPDKYDEKLVEECKGKLAEDDETPEYIVKVIKNFSKDSAEEEAKRIYAAVSEDNPDVKVVIVSDEAHKGSDEQKLLYKMMILDAIYGSFGDEIDEAVADFGSSVDYPYVYSKE